MRRTARWLVGAFAGLIAGVCLDVSPVQAKAGENDLEMGRQLLEEMRVAEAAEKLEPLLSDPKRKAEPLVQLVRGELRFFQGRYDEAATSLRSGIAALHLPMGESAPLRDLAEIAANTADVTRDFVTQHSPAGHFVIRHRPGLSRILAPYAAEALERAYAALGDDFSGLGSADVARPTQPIVVEIYESVADLARVSSLTLKEIETSGTIALCKWNRLMIVSPQALVRGYPWLDTLTHEYTHYIVSRVSRGLAPVWIQEGLAKFEERRWRAGSGGGLSASLEGLLATAVAKNRLISFERMSPSMAKLPSQEDTALAFAEVYTAMEFLHGKLGWPGLRKMLHGLAQGQPDTVAIAAAYGAPYAQFERGYRNHLRARRAKVKGAPFAEKLHFRKGMKKPTDEDDSRELADPKARALLRLGGLLRVRGRFAAAAIEYEKAQAILGSIHPLVALKLGRTYLAMNAPERAIAALEPARESFGDVPGLQAALGTAWLKRGDGKAALPYLEGAIATSPFDPSMQCALAQVYAQVKSPLVERAQVACQLLTGIE